MTSKGIHDCRRDVGYVLQIVIESYIAEFRGHLARQVCCEVRERYMRGREHPRQPCLIAPALAAHVPACMESGTCSEFSYLSVMYIEEEQGCVVCLLVL